MLSHILLYTSSVILLIWGISHLFPTKAIVKGFGDISEDNKRIIIMEWIIEGVALVFLGVLIFVVTLFKRGNDLSIVIYWLIFVTLNLLSLISLFTGFRIQFLPFKLCPVVFTTASVLILLGIYI